MNMRCGMGVRPWRAITIAALGALAFFVVGASAATNDSVGCGDTVTQDTRLDHDLIDCPGDGLIIGADGITLDLNGHTIDGDGLSPVCCDDSSGVSNGKRWEASGYDNVTIKGGTIRQFATAVTVALARGNVLRRISAADNGAGISFADVDDSLIELSDVFANGRGIQLVGSGSSTIRKNSISANTFDAVLLFETRGDNVVKDNAILDNSGSGLRLIDIFSGRNRVLNNLVARNGRYGILLGEASRVEIARNSISTSSLVGIRLGESHDNRIERNSLSDNGQGMLLATESSRNQITRNTIADNVGTGISLAGSAGSGNDGNHLIDNLVVHHGEDGILIGSENAGNLVRGNVTNYNGDDGIDVDSPATTLTRNNANRNGDLGIEAVPGIIDGGGNRARGNGNPLQCVNVACS